MATANRLRFQPLFVSRAVFGRKGLLVVGGPLRFVDGLTILTAIGLEPVVQFRKLCYFFSETSG